MMIKTAGVIFDFYDDNGKQLKEKLAGRALPEKIGNAIIYEPEELELLPDNAFAAVIQNGDNELRKYACVDVGNVALSTIYFLENHKNFPTRTKIKIASNLLRACSHFELQPPELLVKLSGAKPLIKGDGAMPIVNPGEKGSRDSKTAEVSGTQMAPYTVDPTPKKTKVASVISDPYVDTTYDEIESDQPTTGMLFALEPEDGPPSFPLLTWQQVKTAADFFEEQYKRLHPRTRREFCEKVAARASLLGVDVPDIVEKYGSRYYAPNGEFNVAVETRRQYWREAGEDEAVSLLDKLMEKKATMHPDVFAETLSLIDINANTDKNWDNTIIDPWATTFGIKTAAWKWVNGADVVNEEQVRGLAQKDRSFLSNHFGEDFAGAFQKNPIKIFESMPLPQKRVIARLAQDESDGGSSSIINR